MPALLICTRFSGIALINIYVESSRFTVDLRRFQTYQSSKSGTIPARSRGLTKAPRRRQLQAKSEAGIVRDSHRFEADLTEFLHKLTRFYARHRERLCRFGDLYKLRRSGRQTQVHAASSADADARRESVRRAPSTRERPTRVRTASSVDARTSDASPYGELRRTRTSGACPSGELRRRADVRREYVRRAPSNADVRRKSMRRAPSERGRPARVRTARSVERVRPTRVRPARGYFRAPSSRLSMYSIARSKLQSAKSRASSISAKRSPSSSIWHTSSPAFS